jgi:UDP-2-acetamido-2-deoxy-ribo-hexuluronate aminotransferase
MENIPFFTSKYQDQRYGKEIREKIDRIIKAGVFILGDEVKKFEENMNNFLKSKYAIGVSNGSDALYLSMLALGLPAGSEVITTPFTFFASTSCIVMNNLKPVFVDADEKTYNIDVDKIEEKINEKTKCILPVDLFSQTPDYDKILDLAGKYKLKIVEDSAEAFGMKWKDKFAGLLGDIGVFSFFPTKTLACFGDGGMVVTNNDELGEKVRCLRVHGAVKKYNHKYIGRNSRLDTLQAGILNVKLNYVLDEINEREKAAEIYFKKLSDIKEIKLPQVGKNANPVWYVFSIQCERRDELQSFLNKNGIQTTIYYPLPMHLQECFKGLGYKEGDFPVAEKLCRNSLALPIFVGMTEKMINYIIDKIKDFYREKK